MAEKFGRIGKLARKIGSWFKKPPAPPQLPGGTAGRGSQFGGGSWGHRGVAIGSNVEGERDLSAENVAKWKPLSKESAEGFLNGEVLFVHSTNVAAGQYFPEAEKLMLEFNNGSAYMYSNISINEAWDFLFAMSKGVWCWDVLRVRGKGNAKKFKKPFVKIR